MATDQATLQALLEPTINGLGYELIGCVYLAQGRNGLLRIYIDSEKGITISDCEKVSRQVSAILDVEDPIRGRYLLEVSSPGLNRPLFTLQHFQKFIGEMVDVRLQAPIENRRHFRGVIQAVIDDHIILKDDEQEFKLAFANIAKAHLVLSQEKKHE